MKSIDRALSQLSGFEPKKKSYDAQPKPVVEVAQPTVDFDAVGMDGCKKIMVDFEVRIEKIQQQMAGLPPTKGNKPKIAVLRKQAEELQRDPDYKGALSIVRQQEETERELRRSQREQEEEANMMAGGNVKKAAASATKARSPSPADSDQTEDDLGDFEVDTEVVAVLNSAVEGSGAAQASLEKGPGTITYRSTVRDEVGTMVVATADKVGQSMKRAALRDGALRTVRALQWNSPAVLPILPTVLGLLEEAKLKAEPGGTAVNLATLLSEAGPNGKAVPALVFPALLGHIGSGAAGKWKVKAAAMKILRVVLQRAQLPGHTPRQLGLVMPQVTKALREAVSDARKEVKKGAEELLNYLAAELVQTPEIKGLAGDLIASIADSANMQLAGESLSKLSNTKFMNTVDATSFAMIFPIVSRAMRESTLETKRQGVQIVGAIVNLIASPEFLTPYLPELMPLLQDCLMHPTHDIEREAAKTFGILGLGLPKVCDDEIFPYLMEQLQTQEGNSDESEVDRRGAAHGLSEVLLQRRDLLSSTIHGPVLQRIAMGTTAETKAGALAVFQFLPHLGTQAFLPHLVRCLPVILQAFNEESETVTKQAKRAMEVLVEEYGPTFPKLLLPHMQESLFFESEDARDLSMQLFFMLCDKVQDAVKFGQDFTNVECLSPFHRHSLLCSIYIAKTDSNPAVRRNAALLWKERVQSQQKTKAAIMSQLLGTLKALKASGSAVKIAAAEACFEELRTGGEDVDVATDAVSFGAMDGSQQDQGAAEMPAPAPQPPRMDFLRSRAKSCMAEVTVAKPLRRYIETVVVSCCIEAQNEGEAQEMAIVELRPLVPASIPNPLVHFGLDGLFAKVFEGVADEAQASEERPEGDCLVRVNNLMLMYGGGHLLLKDTTLELLKGHRYGVVGRNGAGKTTLMSVIASGGMSQIPKWLRTLHVRPEVLLEVSELTATQFCRKDNTNEAVSEEALQKALMDVGFPAEMQQKPVQELSGGWRMKLLIASAMLRECDILLLDEPTNHLDKGSVEWLSEYLRSLTKTAAMVISHDPVFLNNISTDIIHYSNHKTLEYYPGNFEAFRKTRNITSDEEAEALLLGQDVDGAAVGDEVKEILPGKQDAKEEKADESIAMKATVLDKSAKISFPIPGKLQGHTTSKPIMELKDVYFRYNEEDGDFVLNNVSCKVTLASRLAIVGKNGAGKSTLLNILCGEFHATPGPNGEVPGEVYRHRNLRMAYIAQHHMFHLSEFVNSSPLTYIQRRFRDGWDDALQQRLINPATEDEAKIRKELAHKFGKYGKGVRNISGRQLRGKEVFYEVEWEDLDDPKQNVYKSMREMKQLGCEGFATAYDERLAAQQAGLDQRPLSAKEIVKHLEQFGLDEDMVMNRNIGTFSAGQKSKLTLGAAFWIKPHIVALDEPTNYIDMETLDALAKGLGRFKGAVVVVSHSTEFVDRACDETWLVEDNSVQCLGKKKK